MTKPISCCRLTVKTALALTLSLVPETGIEPVRPYQGRGIFIPLRLSPPHWPQDAWTKRSAHRSRHVRGLEHAFAIAGPSLAPTLGARRLLSTPSRWSRHNKRREQQAWLGISAGQFVQLDTEPTAPRAFTEFDGLHPGGFPPGGSSFGSKYRPSVSSPLCLPISPLGRCNLRFG